MQQQFDVVVIGGGYGGVMTAARLARRQKNSRSPKSIALIAPDQTFSERIRWHEQLIRRAEAPNRHLNYAQLLEPLGVRVIRARAQAIDRNAARIRTDRGDLSYRSVVVATGSGTNTKRAAGAADHAYTLDSDAPRGTSQLRERLACLEAGGKPYDGVVIGSGPMGIEIAGEMAQSRFATVTIVSNGPFAAFTTPAVRRRLRTIVRQAGVRIVENSAIAQVGDAGVEIDGALTRSDVTVWCAGLEATVPEVSPPIETGAGGRILTDGSLRSVSDRTIYAVGDACLPRHDTGAPPRMSAFFALATGAFVADHILGLRSARRSFRFSTYGQGIQFGTSGVGFSTFPFDRPYRPYFIGRPAFALRRFFVGLLFRMLRWQASFGALPVVIRPPLPRRKWRGTMDVQHEN